MEINMAIRFSQINDYDQIERIAMQGHTLHVKLRPDVYIPMPVVIAREKFDQYLLEKGLLFQLKMI
jgi:hypothetical protein